MILTQTEESAFNKLCALVVEKGLWLNVVMDHNGEMAVEIVTQPDKTGKQTVLIAKTADSYTYQILEDTYEQVKKQRAGKGKK